MDQTQKEIVEQVTAIATASADLVARMLTTLTALRKLSPDEAYLILEDLSGQQRDYAIRNTHIPGTALAYHQIADRLDSHRDQLHKDTGAKNPFAKK